MIRELGGAIRLSRRVAENSGGTPSIRAVTATNYPLSPSLSSPPPVSLSDLLWASKEKATKFQRPTVLVADRVVTDPAHYHQKPSRVVHLLKAHQTAHLKHLSLMAKQEDAPLPAMCIGHAWQWECLLLADSSTSKVAKNEDPWLSHSQKCRISARKPLQTVLWSRFCTLFSRYHQPPSHLEHHVYVFMNLLSFSSQSLPWQIATESPWFLTLLEITFSFFGKVSSLENSSSLHKQYGMGLGYKAEFLPHCRWMMQ